MEPPLRSLSISNRQKKNRKEKYMGSLANSIFRLMLGWIQGIAAAIWSAFTSEKGGSVFAWFGKYWIPIAAALCVIGLVSDLCVYLVRWKPFRRWFGFLHRDREEEKETRIRTIAKKEAEPAPAREEDTEQSVTPRRRRRITENAESTDSDPDPIPAGHARMHEAESEREYEQPVRPRNNRQTEYPAERNHEKTGRAESYTADAPDLSKWQEKPAAAERRAKEEPQVPATVTKAGYHVPADSPYRRPETRTEKEPDARLPGIKEDTERQNPVTVGRRRRLRITDLFTDPEEELRQAEAPQHVINSSKAYREPVYPRGWKKSESDGQ